MKHFLKKLYAYWMKFGHFLGTINGFIILSVFYFVIIGLYGIVHLVLGLFNTPKPKPTTYWKNKDKRVMDLETCTYQF